MAMQTTTTPPAHSAFAPLHATWLWLGEFVGGTVHALRCAREAERLSGMSDAQLARRGIKRDEIVRHAFRPYTGA